MCFFRWNTACLIASYISEKTKFQEKVEIKKSIEKIETWVFFDKVSIDNFHFFQEICETLSLYGRSIIFLRPWQKNGKKIPPLA